MKKIYIVGAGGFGREILWLIERINHSLKQKGKEAEWDIQGFLDDNAQIHGTVLNGYPVIGKIDTLSDCEAEVYVIVAIGNAAVKRKIVEKITHYSNVRFATLIDPSVIYSDSVEIGEGSVVCAGCILTVNIKLGKHVAVNLDCTIGHDAVIEDYVTIYPSVNVSGNVSVGEMTEIGTGTQIIQGKTIEKNCVVGAGTVIIRDIESECVVVGNPGKNIKNR